MGRKTVATGRGGAGKSSLAALVNRYLKYPVLLVDPNPELSLADMHGFDVRKEGYKFLKVE